MSRTGVLLLAAVAAVTAGCQQKMADQPSYRPLVPSGFFPNGMSAQPLPGGVLAREWLLSDDPLTSGLKPEFRKGPPAPAGEKNAPPTPPPGAPSDPSRFVDAYPFELTRDDLARGQERYTIYCAVCHDPLGTGKGKVVERGYVKPPNYNTDASRGFARYGRQIPLREVPVGYVFEVITRGYGAMPRYGEQISPQDRWRVVAYVRALQLSQHAEVEKLPPELRQSTRAALGGPP
jgi:mono/diheme cytochrome c family protein